MKTVVFGNANRSTSVTGTTGAYLTCRGFEIDKGRTFSLLEERGMRPVCILGETLRENLFGEANPIGERVRVGKLPCTIIGTLKAKGENAMGMDQDDILLLPIRVFGRRLIGNDDVQGIFVTVAESRSTAAVKREVEALMRERRMPGSGQQDDFMVRDLSEIVSAVQQTTSVMTMLLSAIAAVSLLVGGIGIMNIMLVSVTERTREIGIRMAVGAKASEVRRQFLVEAAVISGLGGVIGLLVGNGGAFAATRILGMPFIPSPRVAVIAFLFSVGVGVLFGFLPAHRASKLNPVEALRYE
jgi:putative ABC transport system permease protein